MFKERLSEKVSFRLRKKDFEDIKKIAELKHIRSVHQLTRLLLIEAYQNYHYNKRFYGRVD